jgi:hypothetical protein
MIFLVGVTIACFWMAIADITAPPPPAHKGGAANSANAAGGGVNATPGLPTGSGGANKFVGRRWRTNKFVWCR